MGGSGQHHAVREPLGMRAPSRPLADRF